MRRGAVALVTVVLAGCGSADPKPAGGFPPAGAEPVLRVPATGLAAAPDARRHVVPARALRHLAGVPSGPRTGRVRWRRELEGPVVPGPVVTTRGTVLAASNAGRLHAIDLRTGRDRWSFDGGGSYGSDLTTRPAVLRGGSIAWPGPGDTLFGLSPEGRLRWRVGLDGQVLTPAVRDGMAYVATMAGTVVALDVRGARPRERWRRKFAGPIYASPALGPGGLVVTSSGNDVLALHADGTTAWRVPTRGLVEVSGAVATDGTTVIGSNDGMQYGIDSAGRVRWRYRIGELTYASTVVTADGLAYFGDHAGFVSALNVATGRLVFRVRGRARDAAERNIGVWTTPAVDARHAVYAGDHTGHLRGFAADGALLFDLDLGGVLDSALALAPDGALLAGSESGVLVAVADR